VAEIRIERKQHRGILPWVIGLALLALVIFALALTLGDRDSRRLDDGAAEAGHVNPTPKHLRQYAALPETGPPARAA
jgi:hypothetical protein